MIYLNNIIKRYGNTVALNGIHLEIKKGELVTLIGPSGCGKSTLLRLLNRMIEPSEGELLINGVNALELDPVKLRRSIGYVIQNVGLFPHLNVIENVEIVTSLLGWDKEKRRARSLELLSIVGLEPSKYAHRYPRELSGGQQQRVGIARALAADPEVLLMDEPFSAVDPLTREQLQAELLRIQSEVSKTIVFVTHDIHEAILLGDKVVLMRDGQIEQYDTPTQLLQHPNNDFVANFLGQERELQYLGLTQVQDLLNRKLNNGLDLNTYEILTHENSSQQTLADQGFITEDKPVTFDENKASENYIAANSTARQALNQLLGGVPHLIVLNEQQQPIGRLSLQDFVK